MKPQANTHFKTTSCNLICSNGKSNSQVDKKKRSRKKLKMKKPSRNEPKLSEQYNKLLGKTSIKNNTKSKKNIRNWITWSTRKASPLNKNKIQQLTTSATIMLATRSNTTLPRSYLANMLSCKINYKHKLTVVNEANWRSLTKIVAVSRSFEMKSANKNRRMINRIHLMGTRHLKLNLQKWVSGNCFVN